MIIYDVQGVHCAGLLDVHDILSADTGISRQTQDHSFGDHLSSESVSVTPSSVIEASIVLCSVPLWLVWVKVRSGYTLNTLYVRKLEIHLQIGNRCAPGKFPMVRKSLFCRRTELSQSQIHIATDGQSISKSWCPAPSGAHDQICITLWQLQS
jgi:hypothetical protein